MQAKKLFKITRRHHVLFWSVYFLLNILRWGNYFDDYLYSLKTNIIGFPVHMILVYLNIYCFNAKVCLQTKIFYVHLFFLLLLYCY